MWYVNCHVHFDPMQLTDKMLAAHHRNADHSFLSADEDELKMHKLIVEDKYCIMNLLC